MPMILKNNCQPPPQRKTGGRGEHIDLEQRFRVKFNDAGEILLNTTYVKKTKNKLTKLGRCDRTAELQTAELLKLLILLEE